VFSVVPRISFLGSYVRMQGTFTFLSYAVIFAMVLTHLRRRAQVDRLIYTVIFTSLPIGLYSIIQHGVGGVSLDPLPWGGDVVQRVAANMGNAIFVAAYLIMAVFLTLERLLNSVVALLDEEKGTLADALAAGGYFFILAVQLIAIVFTQSRGPWLGLAAGLYVFGLLGILMLGRWARGRARARWLAGAVRPVWFSLIGLTIAGLAFLIVFNLPQSPLASLRKVPYLGRMGTVLSTTEGTNAVRVLIWEGVVDMMFKPHPPIQYPDGTPDSLNPIRPLIGYGPESMWVAYNRFYPPDLAHYEARNASPDRSHNETFDALVRTGLLGFGTQLFLYGSVFYYALRWLGLMRGRGRRNLFLGLLAGGAVSGVIIPWLADGSLRLAGLGLPVGLIAGVIIYVTVDLLLAPAEQGSKGAEDASTVAQQGSEGAGERGMLRLSLSRGAGEPSVSGVTGGRQQLLILAVFAALVAHFVEVHFGIAIASTLTHFWILAAVLVVVGLSKIPERGGWLDRPEERVSESASQRVGEAARQRGSEAARQRDSETARQRTGRSADRPGGKGAKSARQRGSEAAKQRIPTHPLAHIVPSLRDSPTSSRHFGILQFLPYVLLAGLVTLVLTWNYIPQVSQTGAQGALAVLWDNFTARVDSTNFEIIRSPAMLVLLLFTWGVGGLLALAESHRGLDTRRYSTNERPGEASQVDKPSRWGVNALIFAGMALCVFLVYGLIQAGRVAAKGLGGLDIYHHIASHIVIFDVALLLVMLGLAVALWFADPRPRPPRWANEMALLPLAGGLVATAVAVLLIVIWNVQTVRADTYYKQGLAYESAGAWEGAVVLYKQAATLEPAEDYYYLFLGRALLEFSAGAQAGTTLLPADLSNVPTDELLALVEQGLRARDREDIMRASYAALLGAQRLNPLNTDHSANLARLYRSWAFVNALGPNDVPSNPALRQIVATRPQDVDLAKIEQSLAYYRQATSLSPQNAQLWNEMAAIQYIKGDVQAALATLDHSLGLDRQFYQTYLMRGDVLTDTGDKAAALEAYRQAAKLRPRDIAVLSTVGVVSAQLGDAEGALVAFDQIAAIEASALVTAEQKLADLDALAARRGGYEKLGTAWSARRDAFQSSIATHRGQLHLTYRNTALVLRDIGRTAEALVAAQQALEVATESQRPTIEALIADLQGQLNK
jgi:tetratricopeptide (TPR) repeat protein